MAELVSMKLTPRESQAEVAEASKPEGPRYPYGLCLYLDSETLDKLGLDALPKAGEKLSLAATVSVRSVSSRQDADGNTSRSLDLQITAMALSDPPSERKPAADSLYGGE